MSPELMPMHVQRSCKTVGDRILDVIVWALAATLGVGIVMMASLAFAPQCVAAERTVQVPPVATLYRIRVEREAAASFGLQSPGARLAAQIHQESAWNPKAASAYAHGLTQFTPATANWLPSICPAVGKADAWDPDWSMRAQACYMAWLYGRVKPQTAAGMSQCTRWNFALRAYNGGEGWLTKERVATRRAGGNPDAWDQVERHRIRGSAAHRENIGYPRRIMLTLEPAYLAAGWSGKAVCT